MSIYWHFIYFSIYGYGLTFTALNLDKSKNVLCVKQIFRKEQCYIYLTARTMNNIYDNLIPGLCNVRMLKWINIWRTFYFTGILGIKKLLVSNPAPSLFVSLLYFFWQKKSYEAIEGLITYNPTVCMYWQQFGWIKWPCYTRVSTYQINTIMDPTRTPLNVDS